MSNAALNAVFARSLSTGVARLVLLAIADRADETGRAWCGAADIARRANLKPSNVPRATRELARLGELLVEHRQGLHHCNVYQLSPTLMARVSHPESLSPRSSASLTLKGHPSQDEGQTQGTLKNPDTTSDSPLRKSGSREEEFFVSLQTNPAYRGLDLATEKLKAEAWISATPGRKLTRRFLVNWLNRAQAAHAAAAAPTPPRKIKFQL